MIKGFKNPHTEAWNKKISEGVKRQWAEGRGNASGLRSKEALEKAWKTLRGRKLTPEHKLKLRLAKLGKKHTEAHRLANSLSKKGKIPLNVLRGDFRREKHNNWKGGITPLVMRIRNSLNMKRWRLDIFTRDDYVCQICGVRSGNGKKVVLNVDHYPKLFSQIFKENAITTFEEALLCEELWDLNNGRTLCKECHHKHTWQ